MKRGSLDEGSVKFGTPEEPKPDFFWRGASARFAGDSGDCGVAAPDFFADHLPETVNSWILPRRRR